MVNAALYRAVEAYGDLARLPLGVKGEDHWLESAGLDAATSRRIEMTLLLMDHPTPAKVMKLMDEGDPRDSATD